MPTIITRGAASARGFGFANGVSPFALGGTWDTSFKGTNVSLSGGSLTATNGANSYGAVLGTTLITTRKVFQIKSGASSDGSVGVGSHAMNLNNFVGGSSGSIGYYQDGHIFRSSSVMAIIAAWSVNDVIGVDYDPILDKIRFNVNGGTYSAFFSAGGLGSLYAAAALFQSATTAVLIPT